MNIDKLNQHLIFTEDEPLNPYHISNIVHNIINNKYVLDICNIDGNTSILYMENTNSKKFKHLFLETDKY